MRILTRDQLAALLRRDVESRTYRAVAADYGVPYQDVQRVVYGAEPCTRLLEAAGLRLAYRNGRGGAKDAADVRAAAVAAVQRHAGSMVRTAAALDVAKPSLRRLIAGHAVEPKVARALGFALVYVPVR